MKWAPTLLVISLCVNVALASFVAGRWSANATQTPVAMRAPDRANNIDPATRDAIRAAFAARRDEVAAGMRDVRRKRAALHQAIMAEPWDRERIDAALAAYRDADAANRRRYAEIVLDAAETMDVEDRAALARAIVVSQERLGSMVRRPRRGLNQDEPAAGTAQP